MGEIGQQRQAIAPRQALKHLPRPWDEPATRDKGIKVRRHSLLNTHILRLNGVSERLLRPSNPQPVLRFPPILHGLRHEATVDIPIGLQKSTFIELKSARQEVLVQGFGALVEVEPL